MSSRFPYPAYANGWFRVAYADELAAGEVRPLHYFGRELVLFRDEAGLAHLLDAYCPHLGAHLGHGGRVEDGGLRCPFHAWLWGSDGGCREIPYAKKIPPRARIPVWTLVERNGVLFAHHHAERAAPSWEVPQLPEVGSPDWAPFEIRRWTVKSRWLDMNENAVDQAHFKYVHGTRTIPETRAEAKGHILHCQSTMLMETPRGPIEGGIETIDHGPALQVVRVRGAVETLMLNTATPIDEETTDVSFAYSIRHDGNPESRRSVGAAMIRDLEHQMEQDIVIWENKRYWERPKLCDGDGAFGVYRRWMRQFFSEPTGKEAEAR